MHGWHDTPSNNRIGEATERRRELLEHSDDAPTKP